MADEVARGTVCGASALNIFSQDDLLWAASPALEVRSASRGVGLALEDGSEACASALGAVMSGLIASTSMGGSAMDKSGGRTLRAVPGALRAGFAAGDVAAAATCASASNEESIEAMSGRQRERGGVAEEEARKRHSSKRSK